MVRTNRSIAVFQTASPDYRAPVFDELYKSSGDNFRLFCGTEYFDPTTRTAVTGRYVTSVRNHFLLGRRLLWQTGMWKAALQLDAIILEYNPRIVSNWLLLLARKLLGKRSTLWGHSYPRSGSQAKTIWLRKIMARLANHLVVYTETQARELREQLPGVPITAAPNALYRRSEISVATSAEPPTNIICVGRLVAAKKPRLLLDAFSMAARHLPADCQLVFVGEGPVRPELERAAETLADRVRFLGHVADWATLRDLYSHSLVSVSPGYVGLSVTQSLSFGVPMIVARDEPHAPEIEAVVENENGIFFQEDNPGDLARALLSVWRSRQAWTSSRRRIAEDCASRYSVEVMARRLMEACLGVDQPVGQELSLGGAA